MKDLLLKSMRSSITRAFWAGALFQGFLGMAFQSWVGGVEILRQAQEGSANIHWAVWLFFSLPVFLFYRQINRDENCDQEEIASFSARCISSDTITNEGCMNEKPIAWLGSSLRDLKDDDIFTPNARREAGRQLSQVQKGLDPDHWKPFNDVGPGTKEIIIDLDDGWFRVMYVAKFPESIFVLHCFKKKTNTTSKHDKSVAATRYKALVQERSKK